MTQIDRHALLSQAIDNDRIGVALQLVGEKGNYADLLHEKSSMSDNSNIMMYDNDRSVELYRNFLNWLFATFGLDETEFRESCIAALHLKKGDRVLVTSCGLGEDVAVCCRFVGSTGTVHAQDLSSTFIAHASSRVSCENAIFTVSNALSLPYRDNYFDAVYHFGGINLFGDLRLAVSEMTRVCRVGGRVVFGDESVAEHLRSTDYGKMMMNNNKLWSAPLPLEDIPVCADSLEIKYVLGNCFYLACFNKAEGVPHANLDVEHVGYRGGTIRTRYFGEVEGIDPEAKAQIYAFAKDNNTSVAFILNELVSEYLKTNKS